MYESACGMICPVLSSPVQEKAWSKPSKGCQAGQEAGEYKEGLSELHVLTLKM